jgi:hypothetical protein
LGEQHRSIQEDEASRRNDEGGAQESPADLAGRQPAKRVKRPPPEILPPSGLVDCLASKGAEGQIPPPDRLLQPELVATIRALAHVRFLSSEHNARSWEEDGE